MKFINQKGTNIYTCNFMSTLLWKCKCMSHVFAMAVENKLPLLQSGLALLGRECGRSVYVFFLCGCHYFFSHKDSFCFVFKRESSLFVVFCSTIL